MDVSMVDTEDTTARGRLRLPLMLSLAKDTTAGGRLMLRPNPDMDTTAVDTDMAATDTDVSMVDTADTTDKFKSSGINLHSFTATFILVLKLSLVLPQNFLK